MGNNGKGIIPPFLVDNSNAKTEASIYSAIDFGIIPGYAYVTRFKNWQISGWLGFGAVVQSKFYTLNNVPEDSSVLLQDMTFDSLVDTRMIIILYFLKPSLTISQLASMI